MPNRGPVVLSIDEVDALLDALPPPTSTPHDDTPLNHLDAARKRLLELRLSLLDNAVQSTE